MPDRAVGALKRSAKGYPQVISSQGASRTSPRILPIQTRIQRRYVEAHARSANGRNHRPLGGLIPKHIRTRWGIGLSCDPRSLKSGPPILPVPGRREVGRRRAGGGVMSAPQIVDGPPSQTTGRERILPVIGRSTNTSEGGPLRIMRYVVPVLPRNGRSSWVRSGCEGWDLR